MNKMSKTDNKLGLKISSPYIIWSGLFIVIPLFLIIFLHLQEVIMELILSH